MDGSARFLGLLEQGLVLADGAMGTMLYSRGVFLNRCFEQLNLDAPEMVIEIHRGYVEAGVDLIETNTFGANRVRLGRYGLAGQVDAINRAAVAIARQAAGDAVLVAGAIGPLGVEVDGRDSKACDEAFGAFAQQAKALAGAGVDLLILETFSSLPEILIAVSAARQTGLPIIAQMTVDEDQKTAYGIMVDQALARLAAEDGVAAVGLNCSTGPASMLASLELIRHVVDKPISVQPNAGLPKKVEDRTIYMCTPEYMAEYAKRFYQLGAGIIGGCCGTTPRHIGQIVQALKAVHKASLSGVRPKAIPRGQVTTAQLAQPKAFGLRSRWASRLASGQQVTTIELTPPRGTDLGPIIEKARICAELGIDAINIPDGPRASCRLSPMVTAMQISQRAGIEPILHVCCRDRNLIGMQSDILGASAIGIRNLLIITGDPPKVGEYPDATAVFDLDSIALTRLVSDLNRGIDLGGNRFSPPTEMVIGVGLNPTAISQQKEIDRFRRKLDAGAEFAITQPVFDPDQLLRFLELVGGPRIPIIAGIWPLTSLKNAEFMANEVPGVYVPRHILEAMACAKTKVDGLRIGIQIAMRVVEQLKDHVQGFAVSAPFGNVMAALAVLGKVGLGQIGQ